VHAVARTPDAARAANDSRRSTRRARSGDVEDLRDESTPGPVPREFNPSGETVRLHADFGGSELVLELDLAAFDEVECKSVAMIDGADFNAVPKDLDRRLVDEPLLSGAVNHDSGPNALPRGSSYLTCRLTSGSSPTRSIRTTDYRVFRAGLTMRQY